MVKSQIRYTSSYIAENEIIHDTKFIGEEMYVRCYYNDIIPTRYLISRSGKIWSEVIRDFLNPHYLYKTDKYGNEIKSKGKYIGLYVRINGQSKIICRSVNRLIETTFNNLKKLNKKHSKK